MIRLIYGKLQPFYFKERQPSGSQHKCLELLPLGKGGTWALS